MNTHTTVRSWSAIGLGSFFASVTAYVLFNDVVHGAAVNTSHVLSLAALVAAIASGHYVWPQAKTGNLVNAALLCVLFVGSTSYVVVSSSARNADVAASKASKAKDVNDARQRELEALARSEAMMSAAQSKLAAACKGGDGKDCKGVKATIAVYDAAIRGHKATLRDLGPEQATSLYAHAAKVLAAFPSVTATEKSIEERLTLLLPFMTVLIAELGTIVFLHIGLGHASVARLPSISDHRQTSYSAGEIEETDCPEPTPPNGGRKSNVVPFKHPAIEAIEKAGGSVSNRTLARLMNCSEGEASKRWQEVRDQLNIGRQGKELRISLKRTA